MFTEWITYPVILVLVATGVGQIRYLNRALKRFDSKVVIPIQFVLFTLSAIIGSAILYGDFKKAKLHQMLTFLYGCAATFLGVFIIAWSPSTDHSNIDDVEDGRVEIGEDERAGVERALNAGVVEGSSNAGDVRSLGRRTPLRPGAPGTPLLRHKSSSVSLIGLSPAQVSIFLFLSMAYSYLLTWAASIIGSYTSSGSTRILGQGCRTCTHTRIFAQAKSDQLVWGRTT